MAQPRLEIPLRRLLSSSINACLRLLGCAIALCFLVRGRSVKIGDCTWMLSVPKSSDCFRRLAGCFVFSLIMLYTSSLSEAHSYGVAGSGTYPTLLSLCQGYRGVIKATKSRSKFTPRPERGYLMQGHVSNVLEAVISPPPCTHHRQQRVQVSEGPRTR